MHARHHDRAICGPDRANARGWAASVYRARMSKFAKWAALALFCAAFDFLGSVVAVLVAQGHLQGEKGATGPAGPPGPRGEAGPAGQAGKDADVARLQYVLAQLDGRVADLGGSPGVGDGCAMVTRLVTDVATGFSGGLTVSHTPIFVCLNPE